MQTTIMGMRIVPHLFTPFWVATPKPYELLYSAGAPTQGSHSSRLRVSMYHPAAGIAQIREGTSCKLSGGLPRIRPEIAPDRRGQWPRAKLARVRPARTYSLRC